MHWLIRTFFRIVIIGMSCVNKAPIMANMMKSHSSAGISRMGMYTEAMIFANATVYGILQQYPLTEYGENVCLLFQDIALIALIWKYSVDTTRSEKIQFVAAAIMYLIIIVKALPKDQRYLLQASNIVIFVYSRIVQIGETHKLKHTGAQSLISNVINVWGNIARIFTTLSETPDDMSLLTGYSLGVVFNTAVLVQFFIYRQTTKNFWKHVEEDKVEELDTTTKKKQ